MIASNLRDFHHASFHGRIGIARVDITPPVGIPARNWGAAKHEIADSIHRPLTLTALTLATAAGEASDASSTHERHRVRIGFLSYIIMQPCGVKRSSIFSTTSPSHRASS